MDWTKRWRLIWWSLVTATFFAIFWTSWYLIVGNVPAINSIKMSEKWTLELPFAVSRWWDVPLALVWAYFLIFLFTSKKMREILESEKLSIGLHVVLIFGLFVLIAGLAVAPVFGLVVGSVVAPVFGLALFLYAGLAYCLIVAMVSGVFYAVTYVSYKATGAMKAVVFVWWVVIVGVLPSMPLTGFLFMGIAVLVLGLLGWKTHSWS